eukprot:51415_1
METKNKKGKPLPRRRTAFVYGIPVNSSEAFLHKMVAPFSNSVRIYINDPSDTLTSQTVTKFMRSTRIYKLYYYHLDNININMLNEKLLLSNRSQMILKSFYASFDENKPVTIQNKCNKCSDVIRNYGFYTISGCRIIYCVKCARLLAKAQLIMYDDMKNVVRDTIACYGYIRQCVNDFIPNEISRQIAVFNVDNYIRVGIGNSRVKLHFDIRSIAKNRHITDLKHIWLGYPLLNNSQQTTAFVVFPSNQTSKFSFVHGNISYKGAFAAHYYAYAKLMIL